MFFIVHSSNIKIVPDTLLVRINDQTQWSFIKRLSLFALVSELCLYLKGEIIYTMIYMKKTITGSASLKQRF